MPLNELEILVARCGHDVVAFGLATTLCRNLGFSCRLLVGLEPRAEEQWVEIAAGSADLTIGIRDADRSVLTLYLSNLGLGSVPPQDRANSGSVRHSEFDEHVLGVAASRMNRSAKDGRNLLVRPPA